MPGFLPLLCQLAADPTIVDTACAAAAALLGAVVRRRWSDDDPREPSIISAQDKATVRSMLPDLVICAPSDNVSRMATQSVVRIAADDFPDRWVELPDVLAGKLSSASEPRACARAAYLARHVLKRYQNKRTKDGARILSHSLHAKLLPHMYNLATTCLRSRSPTSDLLLSIVVKSFYSCICAELNGPVIEPATFSAWLEVLTTVLQLPPEGPADPHEDPHMRARESGLCKAQKWAALSLATLASRFPDPDMVPESSREGAVLVKAQLPALLPCIVKQLAAKHEGQFVAPRVFIHCMAFIASACEWGSCFKLLRPHVGFLVQHVILPTLTLTQEDLECMEDEPDEFIRSHYNAMRSGYDAREGACDLAASLTYRRADAVLPVALPMAAQVMLQYCAAAGGDGTGMPATAAQAGQMDGVLRMLASMQGALCKPKCQYKDEIEPLLFKAVVPLLKSPVAHLRARALWTFAMFSAHVQWKDAAKLTAALELVFPLFQDPVRVVRYVAAAALAPILNMPHATELLRGVVPQLLETYFSLINDLQVDDVITALNKIIETFPNEVRGMSVTLVQRLLQLFAQFVAAGDSNDADDEDNAEMAAYACMDCLVSVLDHWQWTPESGPAMEAALRTVVHECLGHPEGAYLEYLESVLQLVYQLGFHAPPGHLPPLCVEAFHMIMTASQTWCPDYSSEITQGVLPLAEKMNHVWLSSEPPFSSAPHGTMLEAAIAFHTKMVEDMSEDEQLWSARLFVPAVLLTAENPTGGTIPASARPPVLLGDPSTEPATYAALVASGEPTRPYFLASPGAMQGALVPLLEHFALRAAVVLRQPGAAEAAAASSRPHIQAAARDMKTSDLQVAHATVLAAILYNNAEVAMKWLQEQSLLAPTLQFIARTQDQRLSLIDKQTAAMGMLAACRVLASNGMLDGNVLAATVTLAWQATHPAEVLGLDGDGSDEDDDHAAHAAAAGHMAGADGLADDEDVDHSEDKEYMRFLSTLGDMDGDTGDWGDADEDDGFYRPPEPLEHIDINALVAATLTAPAVTSVAQALVAAAPAEIKEKAMQMVQAGAVHLPGSSPVSP